MLLDDKRTGAQTFGLLNIRDRVRSFGGKFHIDSGPKRGTKITLWLPRGPQRRSSQLTALSARGDAGR